MSRKLLTTLILTSLLLFGWLFLAETQSIAKAATTPAQTLTQTITTTNDLVIAPIVVDRYPQQNYVDSVWTSIGLTFDRAMNRGSIASALRIEPPMRYRLSVYANSLNIEPREPFTPGLHYQFTLAGTATDVDGVPLGEDYHWDFHVPAVINTLTGPTPNNPTAHIQIYFNYSVDPQRVKQALSIEPAVEGNLTWNEASTLFTFTPATPLLSDTDYVIGFQSDLRDLGDNRLPAPPPRRLSTALPIVGISPVGAPNYGSGAHPATPIEVTFDRPMDQSQVGSALHISPTTAGDLTWDGNTLRFTPTRGYFEPLTAYTVTLDTGLQGEDGQVALTDPYQWTFRTGYLNDVTDFGWGANVQLVDADGRRAVQFQVMEPSLESVQMRLFRLTFDQFRERYVDSLQGNGWTYRPISTEGTEAVQEWQVEAQLAQDASSTDVRINAREVILPEDLPPGLYVFEVEAGYS
jgi:hypothetical protein